MITGLRYELFSSSYLLRLVICWFGSHFGSLFICGSSLFKLTHHTTAPQFFILAFGSCPLVRLVIVTLVARTCVRLRVGLPPPPYLCRPLYLLPLPFALHIGLVVVIAFAAFCVGSPLPFALVGSRCLFYFLRLPGVAFTFARLAFFTFAPVPFVPCPLYFYLLPCLWFAVGYFTFALRSCVGSLLPCRAFARFLRSFFIARWFGLPAVWFFPLIGWFAFIWFFFTCVYYGCCCWLLLVPFIYRFGLLRLLRFGSCVRYVAGGSSPSSFAFTYALPLPCALRIYVTLVPLVCCQLLCLTRVRYVG